MKRNGSLKRGLRPAQRETTLLRASLHDRLAGGVGARELHEIEQRIASLLADNARGSLSAGDVVACLYQQGWDV